MTEEPFRRSRTKLPAHFGRILEIVRGGTNDPTSLGLKLLSNGVGKRGLAGSAETIDADPQRVRGFEGQYHFGDFSGAHCARENEGLNGGLRTWGRRASGALTPGFCQGTAGSEPRGASTGRVTIPTRCDTSKSRDAATATGVANTRSRRPNEAGGGALRNRQCWLRRHQGACDQHSEDGKESDQDLDSAHFQPPIESFVCTDGQPLD